MPLSTTSAVAASRTPGSKGQPRTQTHKTGLRWEPNSSFALSGNNGAATRSTAQGKGGGIEVEFSVYPARVLCKGGCPPVRHSPSLGTAVVRIGPGRSGAGEVIGAPQAAFEQLAKELEKPVPLAQ